MQALAAEILGEPVALFEDKLNCKQSHGGSAFGWHQDLTYWKPFTPELLSIFLHVHTQSTIACDLRFVCSYSITN